MAVRFEKNRFIIEVESSYPTEDWLTLYQSLLDIIRTVNTDSLVDETYYASIDFLQYLLPESDDAKKMNLKI